MYDLIYAGHEVEDIIKAKYPQAKITDASDEIHTERFEMELDGVTEDEFYPFALIKGFAGDCFRIALHLESLKFKDMDKDGKNKADLDRWLELSKLIKE
jgi:hypothetical protein